MSGLHDWQLTEVGSIGGKINSTHNEWRCKTCGDRAVMHKFSPFREPNEPKKDRAIETWTGMGKDMIGCNELVVARIMTA